MARDWTTPEEFVSKYKATEKDVEAGTAKRCTKHNCACGNVPLKMGEGMAFYKDKTNKTGYTSWCKVGEAAYNSPYNKSLKAQGVVRKRDMTPEQIAAFEKEMAGQRKPRVPSVEAKTDVAKTTKATPKKAAPKKSAPRKKAVTAKA